MSTNDNRRIPTDNEKMVLFNEVNGFCPMCGITLTYKKSGKIFKSFEVAHIYPANPRKSEEKLLENVELLSPLDVNNLENLIAVCSRCHKEFDNPRTVEEYEKWYSIKKRILEDFAMRDSFFDYSIETEITEILEKLNEEKIEEDLVGLSLTSLKIDTKANETLPFLLKKTIKNDVADYFYYIRHSFEEMDKITPNTFESVATQVKSFYLKCSKTSMDQNHIYTVLVDWLDEKTDNYSKRACEIVIAFFIQDCEVF